MANKALLPPGPKPLPVLGSLPALNRDPLAFIAELSHAYGGDIVYAKIGPTPAYMLNRPDLIDEVLVGRHRECIKDWGTRELVTLVGHGLLTSEGEAWRRQRKLAAPPLSPKRIASYADTMVTCAERAFARFRQDEVRDIHAEMMRLALEIVGKTLLGVDPGTEAERISHIVDVAMAHFDKQFWSWRGLLPPFVMTRERRAFRKAKIELDQIIARIIARSRARKGGEPDHLLARLAQARGEDGSTMSDEQLRDEAITMLLAGHETTALALSYAVYMLSRNPAAAYKARAEVDTVLGDRPATYADLARLKYVDAVIRESLRLYPPAFLIGREVVRPFELDGYLIPQGAELLMSPFTLHRDSRYFAEPERFSPERWLDPDAPAPPRFAYFPFGGGPRVCIGNHFAMMEAVLLLATALRQLELNVVPGYKLELSPAVTLRPARGVPVLVHRRDVEPVLRHTHYSVPAPPPAT